jgi:hypothetical protein
MYTESQNIQLEPQKIQFTLNLKYNLKVYAFNLTRFNVNLRRFNDCLSSDSEHHSYSEIYKKTQKIVNKSKEILPTQKYEINPLNLSSKKKA